MSVCHVILQLFSYRLTQNMADWQRQSFCGEVLAWTQPLTINPHTSTVTEYKYNLETWKLKVGIYNNSCFIIIIMVTECVYYFVHVSDRL